MTIRGKFFCSAKSESKRTGEADVTLVPVRVPEEIALERSQPAPNPAHLSMFPGPSAEISVTGLKPEAGAAFEVGREYEIELTAALVPKPVPAPALAPTPGG